MSDRPLRMEGTDLLLRGKYIFTFISCIPKANTITTGKIRCFVFTFFSLFFFSSSSFFFFFFFWPYNPWGISASSTIVLLWSRSCDIRLQFLTPIFFRPSSTDASHLNLGFPKRRVPSGLISVSFPQGSSSCTLNTCRSHFNRPIFVTVTMPSSLHSAYSSLPCQVLQTPLSIIRLLCLFTISKS